MGPTLFSNFSIRGSITKISLEEDFFGDNTKDFSQPFDVNGNNFSASLVFVTLNMLGVSWVKLSLSLKSILIEIGLNGLNISLSKCLNVFLEFTH